MAPFPRALNGQVGCAQDITQGGHRASKEENQLPVGRPTGDEARVSPHWLYSHSRMDISSFWGLSIHCKMFSSVPGLHPLNVVAPLPSPSSYDNQKSLQILPNGSCVENRCANLWKSHPDLSSFTGKNLTVLPIVTNHFTLLF